LNTTGAKNTFIGPTAGRVNTTGGQNAFVGGRAGFNNTIGNQNSFIGWQAGQQNVSGNENTFIGKYAGSSNTTGSLNTYIGSNADGSPSLTNATAIGAGAQVAQSNSVVLGNNANVGIGTSAPTNTLHVVRAVRLVDGNQALGKVLVSDADGNASWQTPSGGGGSSTLDQAYDQGGAGAGRTITADAGAVKVAGSDGLLVTGAILSGAGIEVSGTGTRMFFNPSKAAFRAGYVENDRWDDINLGIGSIGLGISTQASGYASISIGSYNSSLGTNSVTLGTNNVASGNYSTSIGWWAISEGDYSLATGLRTNAPSFTETVIGAFNTEYTPSSSTESVNTDRLFTIGNGTSLENQSDALRMLKNGNTAIGNIDPTTKLDVDGQVRIRGGNPGAGKVLTSDANGLATWQTPSGGGGGSSTLDQAYDQGGAGAGRTITADAGAVRISGSDGLLVNGTFGSGANPELTGAGTRMFFNPRKAAFRSGTVSGTQWNNANIGDYSVAIGQDNTASGSSSVALGASNTASNQSTLALGGANAAIAPNAVAIGSANTVNESFGIAVGNNNTATAQSGAAFGNLNNASALGATAIGYSNSAAGVQSTAIGIGNITWGANAMAIGNGSTANAESSMTLGTGATTHSPAEIALGSHNTLYTPASPTAWNDADRLLVVGNGVDDSNRSDALTILKNGNVGIGQSVPTADLEVSGQVKITGGNPGAGKVLTSDANGLATWQTPSAGGGGGSSTLDQAYDQGGAGAGRTITADAGAVKVAGTDGLLVTGSFNSGAGVEVSGAGTRMFFNPKKAAFRVGQVDADQWDESNVGVSSMAIGEDSKASGQNSLAIGLAAIASGPASMSISNGGTASGTSSFAMGNSTVATGQYALALGRDANAGGDNSIAIGRNNGTLGANSISLGFGGVTLGLNSATLGNENTVAGSYSVVLGNNSAASGEKASVFGDHLMARSGFETVVGRFNVDVVNPNSTDSWHVNDRLFVVGNGTADNSRSDAMVILKNGNTGVGTSNPLSKFEVSYSSGLGTPQALLTETTADNYARLTLRNSNQTSFWTMSALNTGTAGNDRLNLYHSVAGDVLTLSGGGNVGIGYGTPTYKLAVNGDAAKPGGGSWTVASDARLKQDINEYKDGLKEILAIRPVTYRYNEQSGHNTEKEYVGVIAQELKEVAPYMVGSFQKDEQTYLDVDNSAMTYMLINAMKEVNTKVEAVSTEGMVSREEFENKLAQKDAEIAELKSLVNQILTDQRQFEGDLQQCCFEHSNANGATGLDQQSALDTPQLEQNQPNPFHENTTIKYYLPNGTRTASITISDLNGVQLKTLDLGGTRGFGQVLISGGAFAAGTYIYTLTVNGKVMDSKRMVLL
jgi:hypothetical protein